MKKTGKTLLEHCQEEIQKLQYNIQAGKDPKNARNHLDGFTLKGLNERLEKLKSVEQILKKMN